MKKDLEELEIPAKDISEIQLFDFSAVKRKGGDDQINQVTKKVDELSVID